MEAYAHAKEIDKNLTSPKNMAKKGFKTGKGKNTPKVVSKIPPVSDFLEQKIVRKQCYGEILTKVEYRANIQRGVDEKWSLFAS
jgi:hypothetical protein